MIKLESCRFKCFCPGTSLMLRVLFFNSILLLLPTWHFIKDTCCPIFLISSICTNSINFEFISFLFFQIFELTVQSPFLQYLSSKCIRDRHCLLKAALAAALGSDTLIFSVPLCWWHFYLSAPLKDCLNPRLSVKMDFGVCFIFLCRCSLYLQGKRYTPSCILGLGPG